MHTHTKTLVIWLEFFHEFFFYFQIIRSNHMCLWAQKLKTKTSIKKRSYPYLIEHELRKYSFIFHIKVVSCMNQMQLGVSVTIGKYLLRSQSIGIFALAKTLSAHLSLKFFHSFKILYKHTFHVQIYMCNSLSTLLILEANLNFVEPNITCILFYWYYHRTQSKFILW